MIRSQKGFAHVALILIFFAVLALIALAFILVRNSRPHSNKTSSSGNPSPAACESKDGLEICVSSSKSRLSSSETTEIKTVISNNTNSDITEIFSCTFTDPSVYLNDENLSMGTICGLAITDKVIKAQSSETFKYMLSGSKMKTGDNKIKSAWAEYESGTITIQKSATGDSETSKQLQVCQNLKDDIDFNQVPDYCASITIVLKDSSTGHTCTYWKGLIKKANLSIPCTSVMDIGVGYVYVPRDDAEKYKTQLKSLPEVKSVSVDI